MNFYVCSSIKAKDDISCYLTEIFIALEKLPQKLHISAGYTCLSIECIQSLKRNDSSCGYRFISGKKAVEKINLWNMWNRKHEFASFLVNLSLFLNLSHDIINERKKWMVKFMSPEPESPYHQCNRENTGGINVLLL